MDRYKLLPKNGLSRAQVEAEAQDAAWAMYPRWVIGRYYSADQPPFSIASATSAVSLSANVLRAHLLVIPPGSGIDRLVIPNITVAAGAGKVARLGLYAYDHATAYPGALIMDGGEVTVDATGERTVTVSLSPDPGLYVLAEVHNEAFTGQVWSSSVQSPLGTASGAGTLGVSWLSAMTYAALPDPFPAGASYQVSTMKLMARAS